MDWFFAIARIVVGLLPEPVQPRRAMLATLRLRPLRNRVIEG